MRKISNGPSPSPVHPKDKRHGKAAVLPPFEINFALYRQILSYFSVTYITKDLINLSFIVATREATREPQHPDLPS
jgi:hypothetical protein